MTQFRIQRFARCTIGLLLPLLSPLSSSESASAQSKMLLLPASAVSSSMGGAGATLPSDDAAATIANPAQLGLFSLDYNFSASLNSVDLPNQSGLESHWNEKSRFQVIALNAGANLAKMARLPFPVGIGIGYSRLALGIPVLHHEDRLGSQGLSLAAAVDCFVRVGVGFTLKSLSSDFYGESGDGTHLYITSGEAGGRVWDFGLLLTLPVTDLLSRVAGDTLRLSSTLRPLLNVSTGYVESNHGHIDQNPYHPCGGPPPTTATQGLAIETAICARDGAAEWKVFSVALVRQAETFTIDGTNRIDFIGNVVGGKLSDEVWVRQGLQFEMAEIFAYRQGTVKGSGRDVVGYSFSFGGLFRLLQRGSPSLAETPWFAFCCNHVDLQFHAGVDESSYPPSTRPVGLALNLVVRNVL